MIHTVIDWFLHLDTYLGLVIQYCGSWSYGVLFLVIFAETGLVVTPFLPGDSLLFAVGAFASGGSFKLGFVLILLSAAAILGDAVNYAVGKYFGDWIYAHTNGRFLKKEYIDRTHRFYEKYGSKTIVIARFVPIIRTFAPFVAGVGSMGYLKFATYNIVGGITWVCTFVLGGYFFGNIPVVKNNFTLVIMGIIIISILPGVVEFVRHYRRPAVDEKKS